ncbi:MAG: HEAT repeat domain-containing protein [Cyanobacteria bacterium J06623_5]
MDNRFSSLFNLTEAQAIEILDGPAHDSDEASSRYIAASHLVNFNTEKAIAALMRAVDNDDPDLDNRIVRRKAVESLGRLKVKAALPILKSCLDDEDNYLVENTAWALGEIGTDNPATLEKLAQQLERPGQSYRTIIHTLANLGYVPAAKRIEKFVASDSAPIASAARAALYQLKGDTQQIQQVLEFLQSTNVNARRGSIQDLIDAKYFKAIPNISQCPVSMVFRLRGIRSLLQSGTDTGELAFAQAQPWLEKTLRDHPDNVALVHEYASALDIELLVQELYGTDFGRCYLASSAILSQYANQPETAIAALLKSYESAGYNDYGAHYHIMRLFGWLKADGAYDLLVEALHNRSPQFQKSRVAAAIALGELDRQTAINELKSELATPIWDLQYAAIMALRSSGVPPSEISPQADDWLVQEKLKSL